MSDKENEDGNEAAGPTEEQFAAAKTAFEELNGDDATKWYEKFEDFVTKERVSLYPKDFEFDGSGE